MKYNLNKQKVMKLI